MNRITEKHLNGLVNRINLITNSPIEPYSKNDDGTFKANIGCYHLSYAYSGVTLHRMQNSSGGVGTPIACGYVNKRELYNLLDAFIRGLEYKFKNTDHGDKD